jgi:AAT family amino acid transporter
MGGNASNFLTKLGRNGVPNIALNFSTAFLLIIVVLNYFIPAGVFNLVSSVSTINFVVVWIVLLIVHLKYRRVHPAGVKAFKMPGYPIADYVSLAFFIFILGFLLVSSSTRVAMIISIVSVGVMLLAYQVIKRRQKS